MSRTITWLVLLPTMLAFLCAGIVLYAGRLTLDAATDRALAEHTATLKAAIEGTQSEEELARLLSRIERNDARVAVWLVDEKQTKLMGVGALSWPLIESQIGEVSAGAPSRAVAISGERDQLVHIEAVDFETSNRRVRAIVVAHDRQVEEVELEQTLGLTALVGFVVSLLAALLSLRLSGRIANRLSELIAASQRVAAGDLSVRLNEQPLIRLEHVSAAFNSMVSALSATRHDLEKSVEAHAALEQRFRHAETLAVVGQVASSFAHEIGSPLNTILGWARLGESDTSSSQEARESFATIATQCERIQRIVEKVLQVARPSADARTEVDLETIAREVTEFLSREAAAARVSIKVSVNRRAKLWAVRDQMLEIVMNLVINAIQAQAAGGAVRVSVDQKGDDAILEVADAGPGIPEEDRARVFEPFFTTKTGPDLRGTGLGLPIVSQIVRDAGGKMTLGVAPEGGALFTINLPVGSSAAEP